MCNSSMSYFGSRSIYGSQPIYALDYGVSGPYFGVAATSKTLLVGIRCLGLLLSKEVTSTDDEGHLSGRSF